MINLILADYYEESGFISKSKRLRKRKFLVLFGWYSQYTSGLGVEYSYGNYKGNGSWFNYGFGHGYSRGNGWYYS